MMKHLKKKTIKEIKRVIKQERKMNRTSWINQMNFCQE